MPRLPSASAPTNQESISLDRVRTLPLTTEAGPIQQEGFGLSSPIPKTLLSERPPHMRVRYQSSTPRSARGEDRKRRGDDRSKRAQRWSRTIKRRSQKWPPVN